MSGGKTTAPAVASKAATVAAPGGSKSPQSPGGLEVAQRLGNENLHLLLQARVLQAKLTISNPSDHLEYEADRVAEQVMRMPDSAPPVAAQESPLVQRAEDSAGAVPDIDAATEQAIGSLAGRGSAMSAGLRSFMEPRFNADFSAVRIHNDANAHHLARSVNAQAFTIGPNIVFGAGHYAPETERGKRLLAHELTHTLQQGAAATQVARKPAGAGADAKKEKVGYDYTPYHVRSDKPVALARVGLNLLRASPGGRLDLDQYVLVVVTDRVYIFLADAPDHQVASFELTAAPPLRGIYQGRRRGPRAFVSYHGGSAKPRFGAWPANYGKGEWLTDYSAMTAADVERHIGSDIPIIIIPEQPLATPEAVKQTGRGDGGGGKGGKGAVSSPGAKQPADPAAAKKPRSEMQEALSGDEYYGGESDVAANYPAFPAHIKVSNPLVPEGGANDVKMMLYWGMDQVQAVWNASTRVDYRWEWWDITDALKERTKEQVAKDQRQTKRDKNAVVDDMYVGHNRRQRIEEFNAEVSQSLETIATCGLEGASEEDRSRQVSAEYMNLALAPVSALRSAGGHLIDTLWRWATKPENEIQLEWNKTGYFLVRCVATPQEHKGRIYASSVATAFVEVRPAQYIAENTLLASEAALEELKVLRESSTDKARIRYLDEQIADLEASTHGSAVEALEVAVKNAKRELARAVGSREKERAQKQLDTIQKQLDMARRNERGLPLGRDGKPTHAIRPRAAVISQETGSTFPLFMQLFQRTDNKKPEWVLYDVSTSGDYLGEQYSSEGETNGQAIHNAFRIFARQNDYGRGLVMLRIPDSIPDVANRDLVEQNVKGYTALTRQRLTDLVTVLTAASIVLPGAGMAAMALGGALAAEHIVRRWKNGTLEADAVLVTDLLAIFSAVVGTASKIARLRVIREQKAFAFAAETADEDLIKATLRKVKGANVVAEVLDIANDVLNYGGIVWGDYLMLKQIEEINALERDGKMTHSEASIRRSKIMLGALQGRVMLAAPMLQRQPGLHVEPPTPGAQPRVRATPPADGDAKPPPPPSQQPVAKTPPPAPTESQPVVRPPILPPGNPPPRGKASTRPPATRPSTTRPSDRSPPTSENDASRTMAGIGGGGRGAPPRRPGGGSPPPPPPPRAPHEPGPPVESPDWLHQRLARERAGDLPAPLPRRADPFPQGEFRGGIRRADVAYDAFNEAMSGAAGREVGIYYNENTGEYRVMIGNEGGVYPPEVDGWASLMHFHPNPEHALTFRNPAPQDFNSLLPRALRTNTVAREFIEYELPDGGRERTEFGIDPNHAQPYYTRIHHPDGSVDPPRRFSGFDEYLQYWSERAVFVDKDSQTHKDMLFGARRYLHDLSRATWRTPGGRGGPSGRRTMTGVGGSDPPVRAGPGEVPPELPAVIYRLSDGDRLVTVVNGRAYYRSLGKSTSHIEGQPARKDKDSFYEFVGALEAKPPALTPKQRSELPLRRVADYDKIDVGWLQKGPGFAPLEAVPELKDVNYQIENNGQPLTTAADLNAWLVSKGMVPWIDFFRHNLHMRGPPKVPLPPNKRPPPVPVPKVVAMSTSDPEGGRPPPAAEPPAGEPPTQAEAVPERVVSETDDTQPIVVDTSRAGAPEETIGEYRVRGVVNTENGVMHRRIWKLNRIGGPTNATGPIRQFLQLLIAEARAAGATTLRVTGELLANQNVLRLRGFVEELGGTAQRVDPITIEIVIPIR